MPLAGSFWGRLMLLGSPLNRTPRRVAKRISSSGYVALYGIYFATDK